MPALRWQDVDLAAGEVTISGTLIEADDKVIRREHPRTDAGWRRLTLTEDAIALLTARRTASLVEWALCARDGRGRRGAAAPAQELEHDEGVSIEWLHEGPDSRAVLERLCAVPVERGEQVEGGVLRT